MLLDVAASPGQSCALLHCDVCYFRINVSSAASRLTTENDDRGKELLAKPGWLGMERIS